MGKGLPEGPRARLAAADRRSPVAHAGPRADPGEEGQSTVELVAALPALLLAALLALQLLAAGYALTLADGAAEAGALALAAGRPAVVAARDALPGWAEDEVAVSVQGGRVTVRLRPPSPLPAIGDRLTVTSSAAVRPK